MKEFYYYIKQPNNHILNRVEAKDMKEAIEKINPFILIKAVKFQVGLLDKDWVTFSRGFRLDY